MIRVVLADDHEIVRAGIKMILEQDPGIGVVAEAADGAEAHDITVREKPDVLLMDVSMPPGQSGLVVCGRIAKDVPGCAILILTMFTEPEYLLHAMRNGALGYALKNSSADELLRAVRTVAEKKRYIHPAMAAVLEQRISDAAADGAGLSCLSGSDLEIIQLLARGYTNKEISQRVYLSVKAVEAHRAKIYRTLGFSTRADLVDFALRNHLFGPNPL